MPSFNLQDYEPVEERLRRFWDEHPQGRIFTELVNGAALGESVVMVASVYKDKADLYPDATGYAQETPGSNPVNKTSWIENCETSAIGRALANLGYAPKGARASREEMQKASRPVAVPKPAAKASPAQQKKIVIAATAAAIDDRLRHRITRMITGVTSSKDVPKDQVDRLINAFNRFAEKPEANEKYLAAWEAEHLPSTAAQAIREGSSSRPGTDAPSAPPALTPSPEESGEHTLTREELESAGQTNLDEQVEPA